MSDCNILIVDDEDFMRGAVLETLRREGFPAMTASSANEAIELMTHREFPLVITDVKMPGMDGLTLFKKLRKSHPQTSVIIMTGFPDLQSAIEVVKLGAVDYLQKPFPPDRLIELVRQFVDFKPNQDDGIFGNIITENESMLRILEKVRMVAPSNAPVLIQGETGTGKELIAQALHNNSSRAKKGKMIALNCAAIPGTLIESEMFGAEKGSYTGSSTRHIGRFERAHKGTLFLDEISELPLQLQAKLLRALQEREIERVGGTEPIKVDVRIVASTNEKIEQIVEEGKFRPDLFFRLDVIRIALPPLRRRKEDIKLLAHHFLKLYANEYGKNIRSFSDDAIDLLLDYHWPGNIRQLQNVVQESLIETKGVEIGEENIHLRKGLGSADDSDSDIPESTNPPRNVIPFKVGMSLQELEKEAILRTLESHEGNRTKTAETLEITARTIRNKLREYNEDISE